MQRLEILGSGASGGARSYGDNYIGVIREDLSISYNYMKRNGPTRGSSAATDIIVDG
jgi:hypothetical protein